ncbi:MAG: myristoyl transferase [Anaerolineae bacterium]|nr:MAG: myristoyl transferase [Anaerolineae bacterium]
MKRTLLLILLIATTLAGCAGSQNPRHIRLPMGYIPNIQYAPFYVAVEKGYFAEAGFEIEFDYSFETDGVALVGADELPFAVVSAEQVLLARSQGIPVVYVATWFQDFPIAAIAGTESGIESPEDLRGQRIGLPGLFGASYIGLRALLNAGGLTEADVVMESIGFNQVEAFASGQIPVVIGYTNNEPIQLAAQGFEVNVLAVSDAISLPANGIITNEVIARENPERVAAFVGAFLRGLADVIENPEEAYDISLAYVEGLETADRAVQMQVLLTSIDLWRTDELGVSDQKAWENLQELLLEMGLMANPIDLKSAFSNEFLP